MKTNTWDCFDPCRAIHFAGIKKSTHQYALYDFNEFLHLGQTVYIYEGTGRLVWILVWKFQAISDVYVLYSLPELCKHLYFCVFFMFLFLFSLFSFGVFLLVNLYFISWYIKLLCVVTPSRNHGSKTMQIKTHPLKHITWFLTLSVHHSVRIWCNSHSQTACRFYLSSPLELSASWWMSVSFNLSGDCLTPWY